MDFFELSYLDNENRHCLINIAHVVSVEIKKADLNGGYVVAVQLTAGAVRSRAYDTLQDAENAYASLETALTNGNIAKAAL